MLLFVKSVVPSLCPCVYSPPPLPLSHSFLSFPFVSSILLRITISLSLLRSFAPPILILSLLGNHARVCVISHFLSHAYPHMDTALAYVHATCIILSTNTFFLSLALSPFHLLPPPCPHSFSLFLSVPFYLSLFSSLFLSLSLVPYSSCLFSVQDHAE